MERFAVVLHALPFVAPISRDRARNALKDFAYVAYICIYIYSHIYIYIYVYIYTDIYIYTHTSSK